VRIGGPTPNVVHYLFGEAIYRGQECLSVNHWIILSSAAARPRATSPFAFAFLWRYRSIT